MKSRFFRLILLLTSLNTKAQSKNEALNYVLRNTSSQKSFALIVKNELYQDCFVWSNELFEYYFRQGYKKETFIKIIKNKLLNNDTFHINGSAKLIYSVINVQELTLIKDLKYQSLNSLVEIYFNRNQLKPIYSSIEKSLAYCLLQKNTYIFTGLENGSLPSIGILNNVPLTISKTKVEAGTSSMANQQLSYYFSRYNYYLNVDNADTSLLYFKNTYSDVQKISTTNYTGEYDYGKFIINKQKKLIAVTLYDTHKEPKLKEVYSYNKIIQTKKDTLFYNLTSETKIISRRVIIPILLSEQNN